MQVGHTALLLRTKHTGLIGDLLTVELLEQSLRICRLDGKGSFCLPLTKIIDDCAVVGDDGQGDAAACCKVIHSVQISSRSHRQPNSLLHQPNKQLPARLRQAFAFSPIQRSVYIRNIQFFHHTPAPFPATIFFSSLYYKDAARKNQPPILFLRLPFFLSNPCGICCGYAIMGVKIPIALRRYFYE